MKFVSKYIKVLLFAFVMMCFSSQLVYAEDIEVYQEGQKIHVKKLGQASYVQFTPSVTGQYLFRIDEWSGMFGASVKATCKVYEVGAASAEKEEAALYYIQYRNYPDQDVSVSDAIVTLEQGKTYKLEYKRLCLAGVGTSDEENWEAEALEYATLTVWNFDSLSNRVFKDSGNQYRVNIVYTDSPDADNPYVKCDMVYGLTLEKGANKKTCVANAVKEKGIEWTVTSIGDKAFQNCKKMKTLKLGFVDHIGSKAFANCSNLQKVVFENQFPASIGSSAFSKCKKLKKLYFFAENELVASNYKNAFKGSSVEKINAHLPGGFHINGLTKEQKKRANNVKKVFSKKNCGKKIKLSFD